MFRHVIVLRAKQPLQQSVFGNAVQALRVVRVRPEVGALRLAICNAMKLSRQMLPMMVWTDERADITARTPLQGCMQQRLPVQRDADRPKMASSSRSSNNWRTA